MTAPSLLLASASTARADLLRRAGIAVAIEPARVDESAIKAAMRAEGATADRVAEALAEAKAQRVSGRHPGVLVLGADQMLTCDGRWYDKPADRAEARRHLQAMRGRAHALISALCIVRDGTRLWRHRETATMWMRPFSDAFLDDYLDKAGPEVLESVGAYRLEGPGVQLFQRIDGDFFAILGLPLLPLMDYLRDRGVVGT
ncbi:MAG: Maf family protein [Alphaproteobacteria bacterium]|nr:Maf family protein [Alphaproteobacteria bacterium]